MTSITFKKLSNIEFQSGARATCTDINSLSDIVDGYDPNPVWRDSRVPRAAVERIISDHVDKCFGDCTQVLDEQLFGVCVCLPIEHYKFELVNWVAVDEDAWAAVGHVLESVKCIGIDFGVHKQQF